MKIIIIILSGIILLLLILLWYYQRQVKNICRQLAFLRKHESNMLLSSEMEALGIGRLKDEINEILKKGKQQKKQYLDKEKNIAETYTNLSHDIRTPLTSLDGYFQLLQDCEKEEDKRRYIVIIKERIDSLNAMLEELFTFTKLKNASYQLTLSECDFSVLLKKTILSYYEDWAAKGISPELAIAESPLMVQANEQALCRVIQNIIKNVLEHGQKEIKISLSRIDDKAVLRVSNLILDGDEINIDRVFERFYKADEVRGKTSTGLGLSIAYGFVKKMNGEIRAELEGNVFSIVMEL